MILVMLYVLKTKLWTECILSHTLRSVFIEMCLCDVPGNMQTVVLVLTLIARFIYCHHCRLYL